MSVKYTLIVISDVFYVYITVIMLCQTDEINTIFQPIAGYIYESTGEF